MTSSTLGAQLRAGLGKIRETLERDVRIVSQSAGPQIIAPLSGRLSTPLARVGAYVPELGGAAPSGGVRFRIAVTGRFNTGKSTLLSSVAANALSAGASDSGLLPESDSPCTAIPTFLTHGRDGLKIHIVERTKSGGPGLRQGISLEQLKAMHFHPSQQDGADPFPDVSRIEIEGVLPDELESLVLIDTLGADDRPEHTQRTIEVAATADAIIAVFRSDMGSFGTPDEFAFLKRIAPPRAQGSKKVFFVVNQFVPHEFDADYSEYLWSLILTEQGRAGKYTGQKLEDGDIFPIDAMAAKQGRLQDRPELVAGSGLPEFESRLAQFLLSDGLNGKIAPVVGDVLDVVSEIEAAIGREIRRMRNRRVDAETIVANLLGPLRQLVETLSDLKDQTSRTSDSITDQIRNSFKAAMMRSVGEVRTALENHEIEALKGWTRKLRHLVSKKSAISEVQVILRDAVQSQMTAWASNESKEVTSPVRIFESEQMALIEIIARRFAALDVALDQVKRKLLGEETGVAAELLRTKIAERRSVLENTLRRALESQLDRFDFAADYFSAIFGALVSAGLAQVGLVPVAQAALVKIGVAMGMPAVVGMAGVIALPLTAAAAVLGALFMNRNAVRKLKDKAILEFSQKMEQTADNAWKVFEQSIAGTIGGVRDKFDQEIETVAGGARAELKGLWEESTTSSEKLQKMIEKRNENAIAIAEAAVRLKALLSKSGQGDGASK